MHNPFLIIPFVLRKICLTLLLKNEDIDDILDYICMIADKRVFRKNRRNIMSTLSLRLPESLHRKVKELSQIVKWERQFSVSVAKIEAAHINQTKFHLGYC
jgi:hypothetical protein